MRSLMFRSLLRKTCPNSFFFWPVFLRSQTEYGDLQIKTPYSVRMLENKDQKNSEFGHFSGSARETNTKLEIKF